MPLPKHSREGPVLPASSAVAAGAFSSILEPGRRMPQTEEIDMKRWLLTLTASAFILASGIGLARAQQSNGDRPMPQRDQKDAPGQQGQGMMGTRRGMTPARKQSMKRKKTITATDRENVWKP